MIALPGGVRDVRKIEIKNHFRLVNAVRYYQISIHSALVPVDHEVRIDPVVKRTLALAHGACLFFRPFAHHRTPLQAEALAVFNHVVAVVEHAVESFMKMWYVVAAVQVVINEDFPVTVEGVVAALDPMETFKAERSRLVNQIGSEKTVQCVVAVQANEHPLLPDIQYDGNQTIR